MLIMSSRCPVERVNYIMSFAERVNLLIMSSCLSGKVCFNCHQVLLGRLTLNTRI